MKKKRSFILCIILIVASMLLAAFDVRLKTVTYTIKSSKITNEIKLTLITDLHSCYYGKNQSNILNEVESCHPDAVLLSGDIFDDALDDANACALVDELAKKYKIYYVSGNHEWWSDRMYDMFDYLTSKGVTALRGDVDILTVGKDTLAIFGIDDTEVNVYDPKFKSWEEQLEQAGQKLEGNCFNLLLAHRPEYVDKYFEYGFDAVLSGHAHGGQFRIPFILNGLYAPNQGFFPKFAGGVYDFDGKKLIVSRGLARESTRLPRVFNRPELVFVNLIPQE